MNVERPVNKNQATMEDLHAEFLKKYSASNRGLKLASERIVPDPTQKAACTNLRAVSIRHNTQEK